MSSEEPAAVAARAGSLRALGQLDGAGRMLQEALAEAPDDADLLTEWAAVCQARGDLRQAEDAARAAVQSAPETLPPWTRLVAVLIAQDRAPEARVITTELIGRVPDVPGVWAQHAIASFDGRGRRLAEVRHAYEQAIELAPESPDMYVIGSISERAYGNLDLARALVADGLATAPQHAGLLSLRAEYAPVSQQPELLLDVLTTNPGDQESRELLDAAVTWERRAASTAALAPVVVALGTLAAGPGIPGAVTATLLAAGSAVAAWAVVRRYRRRRDRLPASYLSTLPRQGLALARTAAVATAVLVLVGVVLEWVTAAVGAGLLAGPIAFGLAIVAGLVTIAAPLLGDDRVLRTSRNREGRVLWGTAWRYGSLRQELALWSGLGTAVAALVIGSSALSGSAPAGSVPAVTWPAALVTALSVGEALRAGRFAVQRYLRSLGIRYRLIALVGVTIGLVAIGVAGLSAPGSAGRTDRPEPTSPMSVPAPSFPDPARTPVPVPSVSVPTFDLPSIPPLTDQG
ncbi:tetratricopeptide repeat protein [Curtobacterium sp. 9128]|uniref:tetratricopeptide repeat protein n=1 Tax=Curtobacterium sp. 9128 TaxID=1793722 RepID=UPI00119E7129|nr:tetratricopeptide repeat protein [Curtobacterium sp. 9128]